MANSLSLKFTLLVLSLFFLQLPCSGQKSGAANSGKKFFESFFVGEEGIQYFIKPMAFVNADKSEKLMIDITFRYKSEVKDSATLNFSILSPQILKKIDLAEIKNQSSTIHIAKVELLFNEKQKSKFISRFSAKILLSDLLLLFSANQWHFNIFQNNQKMQYFATSKTNRSILILRDNLFVLM
jgi:hypothetical protein